MGKQDLNQTHQASDSFLSRLSLRIVLDDIMENPEARSKTWGGAVVHENDQTADCTFKSWFIVYNVYYDL